MRNYLNAYLVCCEKLKNLDSKTLKAYRIDLNQFFDFLNDYKVQFDKGSLSCYIEALHDKFKPKTVKRKIASLKAFSSYCENEGYLNTNPFHVMKLKYKEPLILPKTISSNDVQAILKTAYDEQCKATAQYAKSQCNRDVVVLELLFATGMRVSELCSLKNADVNLSARFIRIMGKGAKERIIQLTNDEVVTSLIEYQKQDTTPDEFFLINRGGHRLSEQSVRQIINKYVKKADLKIHVTPHMFRHTFATLLLEEDVDIRYIQKILGHSSIVTTQIYTHVSTRQQRLILEIKHPRNRLTVH
ncbi:MAG: tyrosine-type recombinase/integrase [Firmicutes bacterium]|nr:tyrosine-type recombinase/integrase [Bacillota bacterium]